MSTESLAGKPLVVYFWREHVNGVERELDLMQDLYETYSPLGIEFLTITDREHGFGRRTQRILDEAEATLPTVVLDDTEFAGRLGFDLPPGVVLANAEQRIVWRWRGFSTASTLVPEVARLAGIRPLPSRHSGSVALPEEFREQFPGSPGEFPELESVLESLGNQPVVIFAWAGGLSSEGQQRSLETFLRLRDEFRHQSVGFVGLVTSVDDRVEQWQADPSEFDFPVLDESQSQLMREMGIFGFPTTFYLDHEHRMAAVKSGTLNEPSARILIQSLISDRAQQAFE